MRDPYAQLAANPARFVRNTLGKLGHQRGPSTGEGRGAGRRWAGIVEETPCLWVTWFTDAAKRFGQARLAALVIGGVRVEVVARPLTFGDRWYFVCPLCHRCCEAIYLGRQVGCRQCLRLGYRSQAQRTSSVYYWLDRIFARDPGLWQRQRYQVRDDVMAAMVADMRRVIARQIEDLFRGVQLGENKSGG